MTEVNTGSAWDIELTCGEQIAYLAGTHIEQVFREYLVDLKQRPEKPRWTDNYVYDGCQILHYYSQHKEDLVCIWNNTLFHLALTVLDKLKLTDRFANNYNEQRSINNLYKQLHRKWAKK